MPPSRLGSAIVVVALALLLAGCAGAILLRGLAAGSRGAALGAGGRAGLAAGRAGLGAAAAETPVLRALLAEVTRSGRVRPIITIDRMARIHHGGTHLVTLEAGGHIVSTGVVGGPGQVIGRIANGRIWELGGGGGLGQPIGRILTSFRGTRTPLRSAPTSGSRTIATLHPNRIGELMRVSSDWYEVRLLNGTTGWVWAPLVALETILLAQAAGDSAGDTRKLDLASITLRTGESFAARSVEVTPEVVVGVTDGGRPFAVDPAGIAWIDESSGAAEIDWSRQSRIVRLHNGALLISRACHVRDEVTHIQLYSGDQIGFDLDMRLVTVDSAVVAAGCAS